VPLRRELCGVAVKKGPLMKHSSLPRRILLVLAGTLALPALAVGQYLHDYCHTD